MMVASLATSLCIAVSVLIEFIFVCSQSYLLILIAVFDDSVIKMIYVMLSVSWLWQYMKLLTHALIFEV